MVLAVGGPRLLLLRVEVVGAKRALVVGWVVLAAVGGGTARKGEGRSPGRVWRVGGARRR